MSKTTTQAAPKEAPQRRETCGVERFHMEPETTAVVLENYALSSISAALVAIDTCADLLNHSESERHSGKALKQHEIHGLLAAISVCAKMVRVYAVEGNADESIKIQGDDAEELISVASGAYHRAWMAERGRT